MIHVILTSNNTINPPSLVLVTAKEQPEKVILNYILSYSTLCLKYNKLGCSLNKSRAYSVEFHKYDL